ncbi:MAG: c-type cytochrome [Planctomycetes bacterium]|nr:c-type cytochrome [Planctomycetota bacterium]
MAATDKHYRDQYRLDFVFALTSLLMLVSMIWMFAQDYNREYKDEQRTFRDVEQGIAQRQAYDQLPSEEEVRKAEELVDNTKQEKESKDPEITSLRTEIANLRPEKEKNEAAYNSVKADLDSALSFLYIALEEHPDDADLANKYRKRVETNKVELDKKQADKDSVSEKIKLKQARIDEIEKPLTDALSELKKLNEKFDVQIKLANFKQWRAGDLIRSLPILDAFASPIKIHQFTINDIPIDYNFKYVTRFDRCMSCHLGIDRPAFSKDNVKALTKVTPEDRSRRDEAKRLLEKRMDAMKGLPEARTLPPLSDIKLNKLSPEYLTEARINEFCAHPRLELFVGANSKHPAERFGCTSCHAGQGSSTSFTLASHTPNDAALKERWEKEHDWFLNHDWEFPMRPQRFVESGCLKCHHQVTDLIGSDNRNEAPKLLRGYNLIKENGCFGCHEIAGKKAGKQIGPDIRLEPKPPLEDLTPGERAKLEADEENPPGTMRKVGPSLYRLSEKTNSDWTERWLRAPRSFRPDTKMPHFYGLANNDRSVLPADQKEFPDAEIHCLTHYLFEVSKNYITQKDKKARLEELNDIAKIAKLNKAQADEKQQLIDSLKSPPPPLIDLAPGYKGDAAKGRLLFSERGCLACHSHQATETKQGEKGQDTYAPAMHGEANFGPNLSQLVEKLVAKQGKLDEARKWLMQWVLDPQFHSPRSRMPVTHLTPHEAADVAAWLLAQPAMDLGENWNEMAVLQPQESTLIALGKVYFVRLLSRHDMDRMFKDKLLPREIINDLPEDERTFVNAYLSDGSVDHLKHYLGKKAVGRLGCYACHDVPGFDKSKPIGTGLNEWGKKEGNKLAFEDIVNYVREHYNVVPKLTDKNGKPTPTAAAHNGHENKGHAKKPPYEQFYFDSLLHHGREGFLNQKLTEPRSYDFNRLLAWDDRARMPQFRFARSKKKEGESAEAFTARTNVEEAEAREAVATFILGLVAEPVPTMNVNQPKGDRLAEVKGRQVLEKYNCAGCHLLRSGVMELNTKDKGVIKTLEQFYNIAKTAALSSGDHFFPDHYDWVGKNPTSPDKLTFFGVNSRLFEDESDASLQIRLAQALRFQAEDKTMKDIPSSNFLHLNPKDLIYPRLPPLQSKREMKEAEADEYYKEYRVRLAKTLADHGPYGGAFANLLVPYLVKKDKSTPQFFKLDNPEDPESDSAPARAAVPPILLGQGERTQTEWLYNFILNPQPVRRMTVLRMPRFNLSKDEARTLVDYFGAVERTQNPKTGLNFPYETITQHEDLAEDFWLRKNAEYVSRMKGTKAKDATGNDLPYSNFDRRVKELQPVWLQIQKDNEAKLADAKAKLAQLSARLDALKTDEEKLTKRLGDEKDEAKLAKLKEQAKDLEENRKTQEDMVAPWQAEVDSLTKIVKASSPAEQQKTWEEKEAYLTDGYRLLANKQICMQCHQVGKFPINNQTQGPPLSLSHERLRPGWTERWVATPQRFLTYGSSMPNNFPMSEKPGEKSQDNFIGNPVEQVRALRDVLMAYPRASALPVNHYWYMPLPGEKIGEKK